MSSAKNIAEIDLDAIDKEIEELREKAKKLKEIKSFCEQILKEDGEEEEEIHSFHVSDRYKEMTLYAAIVDVLKVAKKPMSRAGIAHAVKAGGKTLGAATPEDNQISICFSQNASKNEIIRLEDGRLKLKD